MCRGADVACAWHKCAYVERERERARARAWRRCAYVEREGPGATLGKVLSTPCLGA